MLCTLSKLKSTLLVLKISATVVHIFISVHGILMLEFLLLFQVNFWYLTLPVISTRGEYPGVGSWVIGFSGYPTWCCCCTDELLLMLIEDCCCCWGGSTNIIIPCELFSLKQQHPQHLQQQTSNSIKNNTDPPPHAIWTPTLWEIHQ